MASCSTPLPSVESRFHLPYRWLLLSTAVLQALSPVLLPFDGGNDATDPPIVPPGPFFLIWGVIIVGCLCLAIWAFPIRRATAPPYANLHLPLSLVQLGFVAWLGAATSPAPWPYLTLPIFAAMLACLGVCLYRLHSAMNTTVAEPSANALPAAVLGIYAGWSTPAVWLNAATLIPWKALPLREAQFLQALVIILAAGSAAVGSYLLRGQKTYAFAAGWALVGIAVSAARPAPLIAVLSCCGLLLVGAVTAYSVRGVAREGRIDRS